VEHSRLGCVEKTFPELNVNVAQPPRL